MQMASMLFWGAVRPLTGSLAPPKGSVAEWPSSPDFEVWRAATNVSATCVATLRGHEDRVWCVAWHPQYPLLCSCSGDRTVRVWKYDAATGESWTQLAVLDSEHHRTIRSVSWSPCGTRLACSSFDATVSIWRLRGGGDDESADGVAAFDLDVETVLEGHDNEVKCCAWQPPPLKVPPTGSAEGNTATDVVATCSRDKTVWIWERSNPEEPDFECGGVLSGHTQDVKSVMWVPRELSESGKCALLSCSYDATVKLWEENPRRKDDWQCTQTLHHGALGTVWECALDLSGLHHGAKRCARQMCTATEGGTLRLWRCDGPPSGNGTWIAVGDLPLSERPVFSVDWCPRTGMIAAATGDNHVFLLSAASSMSAASSSSTHSGDESCGSSSPLEVKLRLLDAHESDVNCVRFRKGAADTAQVQCLFFATCGDDDTVRVWKAEAPGAGGE